MKARDAVIRLVQSWHDENCVDFECKCQDTPHQIADGGFASNVAINEADNLIRRLLTEDTS